MTKRKMTTSVTLIDNASIEVKQEIRRILNSAMQRALKVADKNNVAAVGAWAQ